MRKVIRPVLSFCRLAAAFLLTMPFAAQAALVTSAEFGATHAVFAGLTQPTSSYNTATDTYSVVGDVGSAADPATLWALPGGQLANDFVATFSLTATVDGAGTFSSGSYSWVGGSASLGIAAGTVLLAGTLDSVEYIEDPASVRFQSIGTVDAIDPVIAGVTGALERILIYDFQAVLGWVVGGAWSSDFTHTTSITGGPDFFLAPAVSEPGWLVLFGMVGLLLLRRRAPAPRSV